MAKVGGRSADIVDIAFEILIFRHLFRFFDNGLMPSRLDDPSLMERQCTETASAKTSAVADQGKLNLPDRRNPSVFFI